MFKKRHKLSSITAVFTKTIRDLEALSAQNQADIAIHNSKIIELNGSISSLQTEADQAAAVHKKLSDIIS